MKNIDGSLIIRKPIEECTFIRGDINRDRFLIAPAIRGVTQLELGVRLNDYCPLPFLPHRSMEVSFYRRFKEDNSPNHRIISEMMINCAACQICRHNWYCNKFFEPRPEP